MANYKLLSTSEEFNLDPYEVKTKYMCFKSEN